MLTLSPNLSLSCLYPGVHRTSDVFLFITYHHSLLFMSMRHETMTVMTEPCCVLVSLEGALSVKTIFFPKKKK